jgi:streptogramin lyase
VGFTGPQGIAIDAAGNLYVADAASSTIVRISSSGQVSTLAGVAGVTGDSDGVGSDGRFQFPSDLALDGSGNLYVVDTDNHTIRRLSPAGVTGTVAGRAGSAGSADGIGAAVRFFYPAGIAVDAAGNVYVADTDNNTIRKSIIAIRAGITSQPRSQSVTVGSTAQLSVGVWGTPPPTCQWLHGGIPIAGATSTTLTLPNVQFTDAGIYTVVVTNVGGSETSGPATLTVNPTTTIPPSDGGGGGGGGGAPSLWFSGALGLLALLRLTFRRK